ncbi:hypothetical protein PMAYCL1PPCAC_30884, partial [Pristionchus mayeri]
QLTTDLARDATLGVILGIPQNSSFLASAGGRSTTQRETGVHGIKVVAGLGAEIRTLSPGGILATALAQFGFLLLVIVDFFHRKSENSEKKERGESEEGEKGTDHG